MDAVEHEKLKRLIERELSDIHGHIKELEEKSQPVSPDKAVGRLSRMEAIGERGVYQTALAAAKRRYQDLKQALVRIDEDPEFGRCEACGKPIPMARLMLMPESRYCVQCLEEKAG